MNMKKIVSFITTILPFATPFIMLGVSKLIDAEDPLHQKICLYAYLVSTAVILAALLYARYKITKADDQHTVEVDIKADPWDPEAVAREEEEKKKLKPGQKLPVKKRKMTVKEYDMDKWHSHFTQKFLLPAGITIFVFRQWGYIVPLLLQAVMQPQQHWSSQLIQVHVLGKPASGDLMRPWPDVSPMEEMAKKFGMGGGGSSSSSSSKKK